MGKFVIAPHMRLQEWVAEEKGYFRDEGLDSSSTTSRRALPRSRARKRFRPSSEAAPIKLSRVRGAPVM